MEGVTDLAEELVVNEVEAAAAAFLIEIELLVTKRILVDVVKMVVELLVEVA